MHVRQLFDLTGRAAVVTGGYTGLGRQIAEALGEAGANLVICGRKTKPLQVAAAELREQLGVRVEAVICDVGQPADVDALLQATLDAYGRVDILVNNAGITWGEPVLETRLENWEKVLRVNLTGTFLCTQRFVTAMLAAGGGKVINLGSVTARVAAPEMEAAAYIASKGGIESLTRDLAVRWAGQGICVNALAPGFFSTHMSEMFLRLDGKREAIIRKVPAGRLGRSWDLKGAAVFLAAPASDYVTGVILPVDGGQSCW